MRGKITMAKTRVTREIKKMKWMNNCSSWTTWTIIQIYQLFLKKSSWAQSPRTPTFSITNTQGRSLLSRPLVSLSKIMICCLSVIRIPSKRAVHLNPYVIQKLVFKTTHRWHIRTNQKMYNKTDFLDPKAASISQEARAGLDLKSNSSHPIKMTTWSLRNLTTGHRRAARKPKTSGATSKSYQLKQPWPRMLFWESRKLRDCRSSTRGKTISITETDWLRGLLIFRRSVKNTWQRLRMMLIDFNMIKI